MLRRLLHAVLASLALTGTAAFAQELDPGRDLDRTREQLERTREAEAALRAEIDELRGERAKLNTELIRTAESIRFIEERIADSEDQIRSLSASETDLRATLSERREVLASLLGSLQRMGRQPPPALLVEPEDALAAVRSAMLLGAVLPELRLEAEALAADLTELSRVRRELEDGRATLAREKSEIDAARARIAALIDTRQAALHDRERALADEEKRAAQLARDVRDLESLITRMEAEVAPAREAAQAAQAAPAPPADERTRLAALGDPGRLSPAIAFSAAKGRLPMPVNGITLAHFGAPEPEGGTYKGQTLSTRAAAQVTAPCDGWVVYAGPFRSYGQLLILNAGDGYHVLLAGMERITVELGQFVLTGEPVAVMGQGGTQAAAAAGLEESRSVLYIEFRKDGAPVDPSPWWAATGSERVRG